MLGAPQGALRQPWKGPGASWTLTGGSLCEPLGIPERFSVGFLRGARGSPWGPSGAPVTLDWIRGGPRKAQGGPKSAGRAEGLRGDREG